VTWYTWLEQGRPIRASVQVLEAVARTLRLDAIERQHLFRLAEMPDAAHPDGSGPVPGPQIQVVLDGLNPMPASVVTERFDILAWNTAYEALFPYIAQASPGQRNALLYIFTRPECCSAVENRGDQRTVMVAQLPDNVATRMAMERLVADPVQHHFPCWPAHQARTRDLLTV
jgi:MmyB-like transcription regulator ligand binding domain/Helix-turn-helix domain